MAARTAQVSKDHPGRGGGGSLEAAGKQEAGCTQWQTEGCGSTGLVVIAEMAE